MSKRATTTHEEYIQQVRDIVVADALRREAIAPEEAERLSHAKLVYGIGDGRARGVTYFDAWQNGVGKVEAVEICATAEESWVQLAGTTIHELAHVLMGHGHGHNAEWKKAAVRLGFTKRPDAAGQVYYLALFRPEIRRQITELAKAIADGRPEFHRLGYLTVAPRPCSQGTGTRGGRSRGKGSGSRLRLYECECEEHDGRPGPYKVRIASDTFDATCSFCGAKFRNKSAEANEAAA